MSQIWNKKIQLTLSALVAVQILPLMPTIPLWVTGVAGALVVWKFLYLLRGFKVPSKIQINLIAVAGIVGVYFTKHTLIGEDSATAGLAIIAGCKLLETDRYRDAMITIVLCFILLMTLLLFSQSLGVMIYLSIDVFLLVQLFLQLHPSNTSLFSFKVAGRLILMVLPVWLALFVIFPRFTVGFWQRESTASQTGFSEEMNPGMVGRVAQSDELAFRVQFEDLSIQADELYWRGSILSLMDGLHWSKTPLHLPVEEWDFADAEKNKPLHYQIFLEPYFQRWLFALDYYDARMPIQLGTQFARRNNGAISEASQPLLSRVSYEGNAVKNQPRQLELTDLERRTYLQLPRTLDPKIRELAQKLRSSNGKATESIVAMYDWFRREKFFYSLTPGEVTNLSQFLFQSKIGFCEHYAAAAATLSRAMGFPSRVVIGFQGADKNDLGDYWMVRNRNAHAWAETWVEESGGGGRWQRVDLVAVVTPMRMILGSDFFRLISQIQLGDPRFASSQQQLTQTAWSQAQSRLQMVVDAVEMKWIRLLLSYDFEYQQQLISRVGIKNASRFTFVGILISLLVGLFLLFRIFLQRRADRVDPVLTEWRKFCARLAKQGLARRPNEGPRDFIERAIQHFPDRQDELREVGAKYLQRRYGLSLFKASRTSAFGIGP